MGAVHDKFDEGELAVMMLDGMSVAVTAIDMQGNIIYYNDYAAKTFNRKPEHIGSDVRKCHKPESAAMIDRILKEFAGGRREEYRMLTGKGRYDLTILPLMRGAELAGCFECVVERRQ